MGRITELDRLPVVDAHIGHWTGADALGTPIEIEPGYGLPQLQTQRDEYHAKGEEIVGLETLLDQLRAERDSVFGESHEDDDGVWFRLRQYKSMVRLKLGSKHPLSKTVPNLGTIRVERYLTIIHRFLEHWARVDAALGTPMTLGSFAIADLQTAHDTIDTKIKAIEANEEAALPLARAEREKLFGDLSEDERDDESIIARLQLYAITIETTFPGQPIADTLPEIFPSSAPPAELPTFRFNWNEPSPGELNTWFEIISLPDADHVFLKEGAFEQTEPFDTSAPDGIQINTWPGVTIVDEIDELEIRAANGVTLARGERDMSLPEPTPA